MSLDQGADTASVAMFGEAGSDALSPALTASRPYFRFVEPAPVLAIGQTAWTSRAVTRFLDIVLASALLIVALPALMVVAVLLQLDSPGRLFFVQRRIGRDGKSFGCIKFRTMCQDAAEVLEAYLRDNPEARAEWNTYFKLKDDPRVTRLTSAVRKFSIDEFPQLINIIRGEMTIVGPRPIIAAEIEKYGPYFTDYCAVKPGLTGLWQISGRNNVSYARRVALDRFYVRRKSVLLDMKIIALTIPAVLGARGSY